MTHTDDSDGSNPSESRILWRSPRRRRSVRDWFTFLLDGVSVRHLNRLAHKYHKEKRRQLVVFAFDWIGLNINLYGIYDKTQLDLIFDWLSRHAETLEASVALDVGANIGNHSLYFSDHFARVFSFEPNPRTYKVLCLNAELANNIRCFNVGLSNQPGSGRLNIFEADTGRSSLKQHGDAAQAAEIVLARLDDAIPKDVRISLIKIDVEGWEYQVLEGGEGMIKRHQPVILFEQNKDEFRDGTTSCIALLRSWGYRTIASIDRAPYLSGGFPKFLKPILYVVERAMGSSLAIAVHKEFEHRAHSAILAIPDWIGLEAK